MAMTLKVDSRTDTWAFQYAIRLFATDLLVVIVSVLGSQLIRFGARAAELEINDSGGLFSFGIGYTVVSITLIAVWLLSLDLFATRDHKIIGTGSTEYKRIADATIRVFGLFAIVAFLLKADIGRGYLLLALPIGLALLLLSRWGWRQWLIRQRRKGRYMNRALLLGQRDKTWHVATNIQRDSACGLYAVGALTRNGTVSRDLIAGVPVVGNFGGVLTAIDETGADTLILTGADDIGPSDMRRLGWDLEKRNIDLIVAPALTDVAGPRIHARPVAGLPLIHVDYPTFEGRKHSAKRAFDTVVSGLLLVLLSPIVFWITVAVRLDSSGPAFFRQERVGLNGRPFRMIKFRSMITDAEASLPSLLDQSEGNGVLFKMKDDPRITRVGAFIRKYSIDELPQLINVFKGQMSLVGPRPPLAVEVANYDDWAQRRLLVKPGITGLWQVSGRSNLSWDDSVRLDLYYVENWSLTGDIVILYRTAKAVLKPNGAY